jgi:hypothetical protein
LSPNQSWDPTHQNPKDPSFVHAHPPEGVFATASSVIRDRPVFKLRVGDRVPMCYA